MVVVTCRPSRRRHHRVKEQSRDLYPLILCLKNYCLVLCRVWAVAWYKVQHAEVINGTYSKEIKAIC